MMQSGVTFKIAYEEMKELLLRIVDTILDFEEDLSNLDREGFVDGMLSELVNTSPDENDFSCEVINDYSDKTKH